jgi:hypothetical protein
MDSFGLKIVFTYFVFPLFLIGALVAGCSSHVDSYWEEELPCGSSSQGSFISSEDGSWSEWVECNGH